MVLPGKLAKVFLDVGLAGRAWHPERRVVVPVFMALISQGGDGYPPHVPVS
jgi:hypothetical protein